MRDFFFFLFRRKYLGNHLSVKLDAYLFLRRETEADKGRFLKEYRKNRSVEGKRKQNMSISLSFEAKKRFLHYLLI